MGASPSSEENVEVRTTSSSGEAVVNPCTTDTVMHRRRELNYLIGNLERLPESARKLFSMGRLYLLTGSTNQGQDEGFQSLFTPILEQTQSLGTDSSGQEEISGSLDGRVVIRDSSVDTITDQAVNDIGGELNDATTRHQRDDTTNVDTTNYPTDNTTNGPVNPTKADVSLFIPLRSSAPLHNVQTYVQWKAAHSLNNLYWLCLPKKTTIYLQPIDDFPEFVKTFRLHTNHLKLNFFETLQGFVQIFFSGLEAYVSPGVSLSDLRCSVRQRNHLVTGQKQFCVDDIYPLLHQMLPSDGLCSVGIVWTDIYPQGYNFVLGEASHKHQAAVLSFGRFETKTFDPEVHTDVTEVSAEVLWKMFKSLSHEVCHLLGLHHCKFFLCAMNESDSVAQAMSQPLFLCPVCLRKLQQACQFDVLERYQLLQQFLTSVLQQFPESQSFQEAVHWLDKCVSYLKS